MERGGKISRWVGIWILPLFSLSSRRQDLQLKLMVLVRGCQETERSRRVFKNCCQEWNTKPGCWHHREHLTGTAGSPPRRGGGAPAHVQASHTLRFAARAPLWVKPQCWSWFRALLGERRGGVAERSSAQKESSAGRAGSPESCRAGRVGWKNERRAACDYAGKLEPWASGRWWVSGCGSGTHNGVERRSGSCGSWIIHRDTKFTQNSGRIRHGIACTAVLSKAHLARIAGGGRTWDQS